MFGWIGDCFGQKFEWHNYTASSFIPVYKLHLQFVSDVLVSFVWGASHDVGVYASM